MTVSGSEKIIETSKDSAKLKHIKIFMCVIAKSYMRYAVRETIL